MANKSKSPMEFFAKYLFEPLTFLCITNTTDIFQPPLLFVADSFPTPPPGPESVQTPFSKKPLVFNPMCHSHTIGSTYNLEPDVTSQQAVNS